MKEDTSKSKWVYIIGIIPVIWLALLVAPYLYGGGLSSILKGMTKALKEPFDIELCANSLKTVVIFLAMYGIGIIVYLSSKKNYRRREEHGSAKCGVARVINKKYKQLPDNHNKLLTQYVRIGLNGKKHRRNLNVIVC